MEDKRVAYVDFYGKQYPLCLTVSAKEKIAECYGSVNNMLSLLRKGGEGVGKVYADFFYALMCGGRDRLRVLAWMVGTEVDPPEVPSQERLRDFLTTGDINYIQDELFTALHLSTASTVEVDSNDGKNAETTRG